MLLGLVDRLRLIVFPVILGAAGREPIYAGYGRTGLELIETRFLTSGLPSPNTGLRSFEGRRVCFSVQVCLRACVTSW
jgi:hypothetical protein